MTTLITGGSGLVGRALQGDIKLSSKDGDLRSWDTTISLFKHYKPDYIIHCAARVGGVASNMRYKGEFYYDNIMINTNVLEAARQVKAKKVVSFLSTCIFPAEIEYPLTENKIHLGAPHHSNYGYAYAKRMLDVQTRMYREQYGVDYICVVPTNIYGIGDNHLFPITTYSSGEKDNNRLQILTDNPIPLQGSATGYSVEMNEPI
ncbi:hypothetical protein LCGC14_1775130, partial [marine sediment metagenome]